MFTVTISVNIQPFKMLHAVRISHRFNGMCQLTRYQVGYFMPIQTDSNNDFLWSSWTFPEGDTDGIDMYENAQ